MTSRDFNSTLTALGMIAYDVANALASGQDANQLREHLDELIAVVAIEIERDRCKAD